MKVLDSMVVEYFQPGTTVFETGNPTVFPDEAEAGMGMPMLSVQQQVAAGGGDDEGDTMVVLPPQKEAKMYFIVKGQIDIVIRGQRVATLSAGAHFGMSDMLVSAPRACDAVAHIHTLEELVRLEQVRKSAVANGEIDADLKRDGNLLSGGELTAVELLHLTRSSLVELITNDESMQGDIFSTAHEKVGY